MHNVHILKIAFQIQSLIVIAIVELLDLNSVLRSKVLMLFRSQPMVYRKKPVGLEEVERGEQSVYIYLLLQIPLTCLFVPLSARKQKYLH